MKNESITPDVDNPPVWEELLRRLGHDQFPIITEPMDERLSLTSDLDNIIEEHNEICYKDFNNHTDYSWEYSNLLKNLGKHDPWMSSQDNDSPLLQEILRASEREIRGVLSTHRKTIYNDYGQNDDEIDQMLKMLLQYRNNNRTGRNYQLDDINMIKYSELLSTQNLKEEKSFLLQ